MRKRYSEALAFVMCTACSHVEARALATTVRAEGFLCKPYTMKDLKDLLSDLRITQQITSLKSESPVETVEQSEPEASRAQGVNDIGKQEFAPGILHLVFLHSCPSITCQLRCNIKLCSQQR